MPNSIASKLRAEIQESKKMRHDFVLRKFSFTTVLLSIGAINGKINVTEIDFFLLLYLVPIVAIAFDFYILAEDYRIKRAGEFLRSRCVDVSDDEKSWEEFTKAHPNRGSTLAFSFVSFIYLVGAALILSQTNHLGDRYFVLWVYTVVVIEILFVLSGFSMRWWLERQTLPNKSLNQTGADNTPLG